jgi:hypothetical protein
LHAAVVAGLLVLSVLAWWHVWITGHPTSTITCQCGDVSQAVWFQSWTPWALLHGHNPMLSNAIFAGQGGANMLVNTSWIFPSLLLAPVTWLFGPVASFNVGVTIAPVVSGWAFFAAVRAFTRFVPGQLLGATLWGFSPFVLAGLPAGHFQLSWLFYPPLALLLLYDLLVTRRRSPVLDGILLGLLTVVQFFTGTEILAMSVVVGAIACLIALAMAPRAAWAHRDHVLLGLGLAVAVAGVILAFPLWFLTEGPRHIVGSQWAHTAVFGNSPSAVVDVGAWDHHPNAFLSVAGYFGPAGPSAAFLGVGLIVFVGLSAVVWYRMRVAWVIAGAGLCSWVLSFGTIFGGLSRSPAHNVATWWLPWTYLSHVPLLADVIAQRFSLFSTFAAAVLLAVAADRWWSTGRSAIAKFGDRVGHENGVPNVGRNGEQPGLINEEQPGLINGEQPGLINGEQPGPTNGGQPGPQVDVRRPPGRRLATALWCLALIGVCWVVVAPIASANNFPFVVHPTPVPAWFRQQAPKLRAGTAVLTLPDPSSASVAAMGWQAEDAMQIRLVGGYADTPTADGRSTWAEQPTGVLAVLDSLSEPLSKLPSGAPGQMAGVRKALEGWGAQVVVVTDEVASPAFDVGYFTAVIGRAPLEQDGAWVWYGLGSDPPLRPGPGSLARCSSAPTGVPIAVADPMMSARCVLAGASH